jgi:hypothetical protein
VDGVFQVGIKIIKEWPCQDLELIPHPEESMRELVPVLEENKEELDLETLFLGRGHMHLELVILQMQLQNTDLVLINDQDKTKWGLPDQETILLKVIQQRTPLQEVF